VGIFILTSQIAIMQIVILNGNYLRDVFEYYTQYSIGCFENFFTKLLSAQLSVLQYH